MELTCKEEMMKTLDKGGLSQLQHEVHQLHERRREAFAQVIMELRGNLGFAGLWEEDRG